MANEEIDNEETYSEEDLCSEICNLSGALSNLMDIDPIVLSDGRKRKLARMKRKVFDALVYLTEGLPEMIEDKKEEEED